MFCELGLGSGAQLPGGKHTFRLQEPLQESGENKNNAFIGAIQVIYILWWSVEGYQCLLHGSCYFPPIFLLQTKFPYMLRFL